MNKKLKRCYLVLEVCVARNSRAIAKTNKYFSKNYFLFFGQEFRDGWAQNAFISIYRNVGILLRPDS